MSILDSNLGVLLLKATLLLIAAVLMRSLLLRASAATRHLTLVFAMCGLILLPLLAVGLPVWQLEVLPAKEQPVSVAIPMPLEPELLATLYGPRQEDPMIRPAAIQPISPNTR